MCGIVAYSGKRPAKPILLACMRRLEYRGYDSAGMALIPRKGTLWVRRTVGKVADLEATIAGEDVAGTAGIGHTRWATHGAPLPENAHPLTSCGGSAAIVHNGVLENHFVLRERLESRGHRFTSDTDSEVLIHIIEEHYSGDLFAATAAALEEVRGVYALVVMSCREPGVLVGAKKGPPLVVGFGDDETFLASDPSAILEQTRRIAWLDDGEVVRADASGAEVRQLRSGGRVVKELHRVSWDPVQAERGGFSHFMLKEIHEQPAALREALDGRLSLDRCAVLLHELGMTPEDPREVERIHIIGCGTSWHAALVGRFLIEGLARIPVVVDYGSEFRYRNPLVSSRDWTILISQSGETADTLAALREARRCGARTIGICNVEGSMLSREADAVLYTRAGPEIGVASTKAFSTQLAILVLLALFLARYKNVITLEQLRRWEQDLRILPSLLDDVLGRSAELDSLLAAHRGSEGFLFMGRGINYPVALEGALKLKEISYLPAEGFPAGELKHGPIALIDEKKTVVAIAPKDELFQRMVANIEEVAVRGARVLAVSNSGNDELGRLATTVFSIPLTRPELTPLLAMVPLQLIAYHIAARLGCDIDQPRNLAKSVTVE
ncbi:MAG: glutamine--fructose-6-phosphate transaminase (isomerizing) [Candidatus Schekmanbacteria bacterium]|nr:glutamine--fructose-6-phosphate transaminase (isomerizing) [Candidatus Schekmanbacteria bacterium]